MQNLYNSITKFQEEYIFMRNLPLTPEINPLRLIKFIVDNKKVYPAFSDNDVSNLISLINEPYLRKTLNVDQEKDGSKRGHATVILYKIEGRSVIRDMEGVTYISDNFIQKYLKDG
jgi:hypothetical protein